MNDFAARPLALPAAAAMLLAVLLNYVGWALDLPAPTSTATLAVYLLVLLALLVAPGTWSGHAPWTKLFVLVLLVVALGTVTSAWDARSIWMFHGKRIYLDGNLYAQLDGYFALSHNDYPVLVPALSAALAGLIGGWNEIVPKLAGMLVWVPALLVLLELLPTLAARLSMLIGVLLINGAGLIDGMVDMPLAITVAACAATMQRLLALAAAAGPSPSPGPAAPPGPVLTVLPALLLATMSLLKNEGLALAVLLTLAFVALAIARGQLRQLRLAIGLCVAAFALIVAWNIACRSSGIVVDLGAGASGRLLARLFSLPSHALIVGELLCAKTLLMCVLVLACGLAGSIARARPFVLPLGVAALYLLLLYAVYLSTPNDLQWHLTSSAGRILNSVELLLLYAGLGAYFAAPEGDRAAA